MIQRSPHIQTPNCGRFTGRRGGHGWELGVGKRKLYELTSFPPAPSFFFKSLPSQECSLRMALVSLIRLPPSLHRAPDLCHSAITRITRNSLFYNLGQGGGEEGEDGFVMCCLEENKLRKTWVEGGVPTVGETLSPLKHSLALVRACTRSNL